MISLSVDADIAAGEDLFGKSVSDLQTGIVVGNDAITGTLKHISDYSSAGYTGDEKSGNFLVLHCESDADDAVIVCELINGAHGPVTLDEDGIIITRIADKNTQKLKVTATSDGKTNVHVYDLSGLTCLEE